MATQSPFLTEEMRQQAMDVETVSTPTEIEKGAVRRFAEAVGDPNPLWSDEPGARKSRYGGLIAPPTFLRTVRMERPQLPFKTPFQRLLDGGSDWEYFEPVRVGDRITAVARITDVSERSGRLGVMLFATVEMTYSNQLDEVVAIQRSTFIRY